MEIIRNNSFILGEIRAGLFASAPSGWLMLDGSTFDAAQYPRLFDLLGSNVLPDMRAATLSGKGDALPEGIDENTNKNAANYDSGALGAVVGANGEDVPKHSYDTQYLDTSGNSKQLLLRINGGSLSGSTVGAETASGNPITTDSTILSDGSFTVNTAKKTYTDVRGKRLLCNFIIRAV